MKSNLLFYILSLSFMALFLFSCGTNSNGVFEKRKHLKGWHFHSTRSISESSVKTKTNEKINQKKDKRESDLSLQTSEHIVTSNFKPSKKDNYSNSINTIKKQDFVSVDYNQSNYGYLEKEKEVDERMNASKTKDEVVKSDDIRSFYGADSFENVSSINRSENNSVNSRKPRESKEPFIRSPINIILSIIAYWLLLGVAAIGLAVITIPLFLANLMVIAIPLFIIGGYVLWVFFIYFVLRLFIREGGEEIWSLGKTFLIVGLFLLVLPLAIYTVFAIGYDW